ncbi:CPBP family intramembrane glutamic endopeptidase [Natronorubrum sp. FCH18a]|uniref:CPBP family intramembrane glutamic endopeptidase n=1 Tax=Natronorubrum sp. FCH18a TaxID=3447018 RepID=UPI003F5188BB
MSDTARAADGDGVPFSSTAVPAVGTVLSAIVLVALLVPVRSGADDLALWVAAATAVVTTGTFLARRHALLERRVAGPVAVGSSLLVVLLSGYVITQGSLGSVVVPGLEWSISLLFVAFFVAVGCVGVGVADHAGISAQGLRRRLGRTVEMMIVGAGGLVGITIASIFLSLPVQLTGGDAPELLWTVIEYLAFVVGLGGVAVGYLAFRERDLSFIDLERPTARTVGWIVVGLVVILGANVGLSALMGLLGIESSEHTTTQRAVENPDLLFVIIPAMLLIVGPFEELLYRNIVQKSLYETFSRYGAVVVASVVFTAVHILAYATAGPDRILASLSLLFVLSLILGFVYERTENLLVPALVHGCYNATVFAMLFV